MLDYLSLNVKTLLDLWGLDIEAEPIMNHFVRRGRTLSACAARRLAAMAKQWPKSGRAVMVALVETSWEDGYTGVIGAGFIWEVLVRWRRAEMEFPEGNFKPRAIPQHSSTSHHSQEGLSTSHHFPQQSSRQHSQYFAATLPPLTPRPEQNRVPHFHNFQAPPTICTYSGNETPKAWVSESANQQLSFHGKPQVSQSNYEHQTQALFAYSDHIDPRFIPEVARLSKVGPSHGQPLPPRAVPYKSSSRLHEEILPCSPPFTPENNPRYLTKHWGSSYPENRQITPPGEAQTRCRDLLQSQDCVKHPALSVPQAPLQPSSRRQVPLTPLPNESSAIFQDSASFYWQIQQIQVLTPNPLRNSSPWRVPGHHTKCAPRDWVNPLSRVVTLRWPRRGTERNFLMSLEDLKEKQQKLEKKFSYLRTPTGELDKVARDKWVQWLLNPWIVYNSPSQSAFQFLSRPALSARSPDINTDTKKTLTSLKRIRLLEQKDGRDPDVDSSGSRTPIGPSDVQLTPNSLIQYQSFPASKFSSLSKPEAPVRPSSTNTNNVIITNVSTEFRRKKYSEAHVGLDNDTIE